MNNLDVTKFGVQELNAKEMVEIDGGRIRITGLITGVYNVVKHVFDSLSVKDTD